MEEYIVDDSKKLADLVNRTINIYMDNFSKEIGSIFDNNATIELNMLFCHNRKHHKSPIKPRGSIKLCVSIYPSSLTEKQAKNLFVNQRFYSIIGKYRSTKNGYTIKLYKSTDIFLKYFIAKYTKKVSKNCPNDALKQKISDVFRSWIFFRRFGNDYLKKYKNVNLLSIVIGIIVIILIILRLSVPRGYHPSLH